MPLDESIIRVYREICEAYAVVTNTPLRRFGYSASKAQTYYGFKAVLLTSGQGVIEKIALFGAHVDERDALVDMDLSAVQGMLLGDKGFIRPILKEDLASQGIELHTPLRSNMKEIRPSGFMRRAARARRLVETVIGQLCERFEIERNRARDPVAVKVVVA